MRWFLTRLAKPTDDCLIAKSRDSCQPYIECSATFTVTTFHLSLKLSSLVPSFVFHGIQFPGFFLRWEPTCLYIWYSFSLRVVLPASKPHQHSHSGSSVALVKAGWSGVWSLTQVGPIIIFCFGDSAGNQFGSRSF